MSVAVAVPNAAFISAALGLHPKVNSVPDAVITGASVSLVQVTVLDTATAGLLHPSDTFHVLVCECEHPSPETCPSVAVGLPTLQLSEAVAVPNAASISAALGLHANIKVVPVAVITGASVSLVHVAVRDTATAGLPHPSDTFHVLVCERVHPVITTPPSAGVGLPTLQLSVAVPVPNAASIAAALGLHPNVKVVPVATITGASVSLVQVTVLDMATAGLPHPSDTFHVLVCDFAHAPVTAPSVGVGLPTLQLSVAVAVPNAAFISAAVGLHPKVKVLPVAVITGGTVSLVHVNVRVQVLDC